MNTADVEKIKAKQSFIGDMDTDIVAGIESEINTCLVLSGITSRPEIADFPYRPDSILKSAADIV
jgi:NagD protein